jgi:regulator of telomere elongation helicase 1
LESPTGTGKTLCLLCASLGWLRAKRKELKEQASNMYSDEAEALAKNAPFIYYSSRTHSQLANVIKELKKTCYLPRTATLSSRDQMCVNAAVKTFSGNLLNIKCKQVRFRKECKYYFGAEKLSLGAYDNTDIEELYSIGQKSGFCPFYFQRNKKEIADILFLPYNYIFEAKFRKVLKLELKNAIVLIDEAHNMENVCESAKSFDLSTKMIDECLYDLKQVKTMLEGSGDILGKESALKGVEPRKIKDQESILNNIKGYLKSFSVRQGNGWPNFGLKLNPKEFFDIFFEGSKRNDKTQGTLFNDISKDDPDTRITPENLKTHLILLKKVESAIVDEFQKTSILTNYADILELVSSLSENYLTFIKSGDSNPTNCFVNNYKIFLNDIEDNTPNNAKSNSFNKNNNNNISTNSKIRTLFLYCFNPGFGFKDVITSGATSVIITSGTLSPIESMETELKCNFKVKLENKHVIDKQQVNFTVLTNSFKTKTQFKFDAGNRSNTHMIEELGNTISDLCKVTPGGILVFFTAYTFMNSCIGTWAEKEILSEIEKSKEIFKDVSDSNKNKLVLKSFTEACQGSTENGPSYRKAKKGGILFSVCRGTSSEGIDFSDDMARMVIIVGIPYPNLGDVKVNLKKEFLDEYNTKYFNYLDKSMNIKKLTSGDWYTQSATKAVNQALGRVIRHIDDYGTMILIDSRYKELLYKKVFSAWLRENVKIHDDTKLLLDTKNFFDSMKSKKYEN